MTQWNDLTIDEVLTDPLIRRMMKADRVDPRLLESMLRSLACFREALTEPATRPVGAAAEDDTDHGPKPRRRRMIGFGPLSMFGMPRQASTPTACGSFCA